ncbi:MAG: hypothetical protein A3G75_11915 [Verrucomicrobia bacterium RIFCSPLOWO2_12_FULL_64_8]|nr:MAG: hypothetical protein A3G75_11915 [Verrucomicrobia bacterium RIFCSPLOWO2_12_FULL_64_8]
MSTFASLPLGRRIPDRLHAVSCSLPTMDAVRGYEEKRPDIMRQVTSGYPRFVVHPLLRRLADHIAQKHGLTGRTLWLTTSAHSATALARHLGPPAAARALDDVHGVAHPENPDLFNRAKLFLQNTGMFLSSREAEDALARLEGSTVQSEQLFTGDPTGEIRRVLRRAYPAAGDSDLLLACTGMNAVYAAFRAISELQSARGRTVWVQPGWLYLDTIALLKKFTPDPARDYVFLPDVFNLGALERFLNDHGTRVAGILTEVPTNPLIQTPDVAALAALARRHGAKLVLDPTIATPFCVDLLGHADVVVNSLTKFAASDGDSILGLVVVNPAAPDAAELRARIAQKLEPVYPRDLARLAAQIGGYEALVAKLNLVTPTVAAFLERHPQVKRVYWARSPESRAQYDKVARAPGAVGGMLSFTLNMPLASFYDALRLPKGPSFGMKNTLICPFMYLAHYDLVSSSAGRAELAASGIEPDLLRLSLGVEPVDDIIAALAEALEK